jgi:uncharacterized protein (DUF1015 family)
MNELSISLAICARSKNKIDQGEFEIGFIMYPSNISEIKALADANLIAAKKAPILNLNLVD